MRLFVEKKIKMLINLILFESCRVILSIEQLETDYADLVIEVRPFAVVVDRKILEVLRSKSDDIARAYFDNFLLLTDNIGVFFAPWYTRIYSVMYDSLSKFIHEANQHGFVVRFERLHSVFEIQWEDEPQVLTMYMLSAGFYVWLGSVTIACIAFVVELVFHWFKQRKRQSQVKIIEVKERNVPKVKKVQKVIK